MQVGVLKCILWQWFSNLCHKTLGFITKHYQWEWFLKTAGSYGLGYMWLAQMYLGVCNTAKKTHFVFFLILLSSVQVSYLHLISENNKHTLYMPNLSPASSCICNYINKFLLKRLLLRSTTECLKALSENEKNTTNDSNNNPPSHIFYDV